MATHQVLGFIGLGEMGAAMVQNLLQAGLQVLVYDINPERLQASVALGAQSATGDLDIVQHCDIVMTSLPSSETWVELADRTFLPTAHSGQIYIDFGTVAPPETRRVAALLQAQAAALLDVPVSGGPAGVHARTLYMFGGGDETVFREARNLLQTIGGADHITYCGASGSGQVVKGVNQLMMGLAAAAYTEALAFGVRAGVDAATIAVAIGDTGQWRQDFHRVAGLAVEGQIDYLTVKFRELPYYLIEAAEQGFTLPLTQALHEFCDGGERVIVDDHRPAPSFWQQLMVERPSK